MSDVQTREANGRFEVLVGDSVVHSADSPAEAQAIVSWVAFQVGAGATAADVERMLSGQAPKKAQGYSGGLEIAPTAEEKAADEAVANDAGEGRRRRRRGSDDAAEAQPEESDDSPRRRSRREKKDEAPTFDAAILDGRMTKVKKQVSDGEHDAFLAEMLEAEKGGKDRKTLITAIEERIAEIG